MARSKKAFCSSCDSRVSTGVSFCPSCEQPLPWASVEERRAWELAQWQKKRTTARKPAQARAAERVERPKKFEHATPARSAPEPIRRVVMPKTLQPAAVAARVRLEAPPSAPEIKPSSATSKLAPASTKTAEIKPAPVKRAVAAKKAKTMAATEVVEAKKPAPAPRKTTPPIKKARGEAAPTREPKTTRTVASKPSPKVAPKPGRKAPKMAPMTVPAPSPDKTHANGNGSVNGASHDTTGEQTEILRELLRRVISIEEKMANGAPKLRRLRLLKS